MKDTFGPMTSAAHTHLTATWRSDAARLRSRDLTCSIESGNTYGMKPATNVVSFPAIRPPRRGVPPH